MDQPTRSELFTWSNGQIVLIVEREENGWIVARGWRNGDRLDHVRRWSFVTSRRVVGQVRRLVREASGDPAAADAAADDLVRWFGDDTASLAAE